MTKCLVCNKSLDMVTHTHIGFHNMTFDEYRKRFNLKKGEINPNHSLKMRGSGNPRYRVKPSIETIEKIRNVHKTKGKFKGKNNPMYGKTHTLEARMSISKKLKLRLRGSGNPFYGKKHKPETKQKISLIRKERSLSKGPNNPMFGKSHKLNTKIKISKLKKKFFLEHPEKHPNFIMTHNQVRIGYPSKPQLEIFNFVKNIFEDADINYPIKTEKTVYFADVCIPSKKFIIEYDSNYWHQNKEKDIIRDMRLSEKGWIVIRIKEDDMGEDTFKRLNVTLVNLKNGINVTNGLEELNKYAKV